MWNVWRTVLEENEKLARARLAAVEVFQQQIADDIKTLRNHKLQTARKVTSVCNFFLLTSSKLALLAVYRTAGSGTKGAPDLRPRRGQDEKVLLRRGAQRTRR